MKKILAFAIVILTCILHCQQVTASEIKENEITLDIFLEKAKQEGFCYIFEGEDQNFNGDRIINGTNEEINRLKNSSKGTIIVRYRTETESNQVLFAAGSGYEQNQYGAILANNVSSVSKQRIDFPDGLYANLNDSDIDTGWHTFLYSVDASDMSNSEGKTVTSFDGSQVTQFPNYTSWFNSNSEINNINYLTIGGAAGTLANSNNSVNFTGQIACVAFVPEFYGQEAAAKLSASSWTTGIIYNNSNISIHSEEDAVALDADLMESILSLEEATIIIKYNNTNSGIGSLIGISDDTKSNNYFMLYQSDTGFGVEYRNNDNPKLGVDCGNISRDGINTVAFKAEKGKGFKIFSNGKLGNTIEMTEENYQFIKDLTNQNSGYLGKTARPSGIGNYPFTGEIINIEIYNKALSDEIIIEKTAETKIVDHRVFYNGDTTGSTYFRIPFLLRTKEDTLIAGVDANIGSTGDSAENIDAAIRVKHNASQYDVMEGWSDAVIPDSMHMKDYTDEVGYRQQSASYIDGVIVEDRVYTNRVLMVIDAFPWNGGVFSHLNINSLGEAKGGTNRSVAYGDGFCTINNKKYLLLSSQNIKGSDSYGNENINNNTVRANFDYVVDINGDTNASGRYNIYHLEGTPKEYLATGENVDDSNLSLGSLSEYSLSKDYILYKNGNELTVQQRVRDDVYGENSVPMSIFYKDSELQLYNTSYLMQFYSDDNGITWHKDKIISGMTKPENSRYFITGPGRGLQLKYGKNAGRILLPIYCQLSNVANIGNPATGVIYSDDGGITWNFGNVIPSALGLHESALVEMPDGSVKIFVRNTGGSGGKFITATSIDGGINWRDVKSLFGDNLQGTNCQISAINLSTLVSDPDEPTQKYPAVVMASADTKARKNGKIWTGLIKEAGTYEDGTVKYDIDWAYEYDVTGVSELFAYSCMTEMANGDIGILYESSPNELWSTGLQGMYYDELTLDEITSIQQ